MNQPSMPRWRELLARVDRRVLTPLLAGAVLVYRIALGWLFRGSCRYVPSCSAYALEAIRKYGTVKGTWMSIKRLGRCQPFHPGGLDPVP